MTHKSVLCMCQHTPQIVYTQQQFFSMRGGLPKKSHPPTDHQNLGYHQTESLLVIPVPPAEDPKRMHTFQPQMPPYPVISQQQNLNRFRRG